jgi:hypothetical protein
MVHIEKECENCNPFPLPKNASYQIKVAAISSFAHQNRKIKYLGLNPQQLFVYILSISKATPAINRPPFPLKTVHSFHSIVNRTKTFP